MKYILVLLFPYIVCGCVDSDKREHTISNQINVSVLVDVTDPKLLDLWPTARTVLPLFQCQKFPENSCWFSLSVISQLKINPRYEFQLPPAVEMEALNTKDDIQWRKKQILKFYDTVSRIFDRTYAMYDTTASMQYSECWSTIAKNLERLSQQPGDQKLLVVYSDLAEKGSAGNAYTEFTGKNTSEIRTRLELDYSIKGDCKGIQLIIIYQPKDRKDDARFNNMLEVYEDMLREKGVLVRHQASSAIQWN